MYTQLLHGLILLKCSLTTSESFKAASVTLNYNGLLLHTRHQVQRAFGIRMRWIGARVVVILTRMRQFVGWPDGRLDGMAGTNITTAAC